MNHDVPKLDDRKKNKNSKLFDLILLRSLSFVLLRKRKDICIYTEKVKSHEYFIVELIIFHCTAAPVLHVLQQSSVLPYLHRYFNICSIVVTRVYAYQPP